MKKTLLLFISLFLFSNSNFGQFLYTNGFNPSTNNFVGINTSSPQRMLQISRNFTTTNFNGFINTNNNLGLQLRLSESYFYGTEEGTGGNGTGGGNGDPIIQNNDSGNNGGNNDNSGLGNASGFRRFNNRHQGVIGGTGVPEDGQLLHRFHWDFETFRGRNLNLLYTEEDPNSQTNTSIKVMKWNKDITNLYANKFVIGRPNDAEAFSDNYAIQFYGYRDVTDNFIAAKIAAVRTDLCCGGNLPLSQGTDLVFYTSSWTTQNGDLNGADISQERLRIKDNGDIEVKGKLIATDVTFSNLDVPKLGIGVPSIKQVGNYRLYVADGILTESLKVAIRNTNDWSDKVFDKDYVLKPLNMVQEFVTKYHHLPDIPSAQELVDNKGYDIQQMDAKILQKVEELTLYLIELKKENEALKEKITKTK